MCGRILQNEQLIEPFSPLYVVRSQYHEGDQYAIPSSNLWWRVSSFSNGYCTHSWKQCENVIEKSLASTGEDDDVSC